MPGFIEYVHSSSRTMVYRSFVLAVDVSDRHTSIVTYRYHKPRLMTRLARYPRHRGVIPPSSRTFGTSGTPLHPEGCRTVQPSLTNLSIVTNFKPSPFHHNMAGSYEEVENRIREAIDSISNDGNTTSIPELAKKFDVPLRRLRDRLNGVPSRIGRAGANKKLSEAEE